MKSNIKFIHLSKFSIFSSFNASFSLNILIIFSMLIAPLPLPNSPLPSAGIEVTSSWISLIISPPS
jgi:hypothetical protein